MFFKTKITIFYLLYFYLSIGLSLGQIKITEQVGQIINANSETERIQILDSVRANLEKIDNKDAIQEWDNLIELCKKMDFKTELGFCYYFRGIKYKNSGEYFLSYISYEESKKIFEDQNYIPGLAKVYNGLGILYKELNNFEQSLEHYHEGAKLFTILKDTVRVGWIYLNMGVMWEKQDSLTLAKIHLWKSKALLKKLADPSIISCYINLGDVYKRSEIPDSAHYYYTESYTLSKKQATWKINSRRRFIWQNFYLHKIKFQKQNL